MKRICIIRIAERIVHSELKHLVDTLEVCTTVLQ